MAASECFNSWYYKLPVYTVEVVISIQTEMAAEHGERVIEQLFSVAFLKTSWAS